MRHFLPTAFPTQNSHRIVLHNVSDDARDFDRVEDILADGLAAGRRALAVHDLPGDYAAKVSRATVALREHILQKRRLLSVKCRDDLEWYLSAGDEWLRNHEPDDRIEAVRVLMAEALAISHRVADLLAAEKDVGWHRGIVL